MKKILTLVLVACMVFGLAACGTKEGTASGGNADGVTLHIITTDSGPIRAAMKNIDKFTEKTGIKVEFELYEFQECIDKENIVAASKGTDIDVLCYRPIQETTTWYENGYFEPLNDYIKASADWNYEDFGESAREVTTVNGDIVGVPYLVEGEIIWYNKAIFKEYGIDKLPTTYDELLEVAKKCNDPANNVYGVALRGAGNGAVTQVSGFLYGFGGDFYDEETMTATMNTPEALKALRYYADLMKYAPEGMSALSNTEAINYFNQGITAMRIDAYAQTFNHTDPEMSNIVDDLGYMAFPAGPTGEKTPYNTVAWAWGLYSGSQHKDEAWEFIKWASSYDQEVAGMLEEGWSARVSVWSDKAVLDKMDPELAEAVADIVEHGQPYDRPHNANASEVRALVGECIDAAYKMNDAELKAFCDTKNAEIQAILDTEK